MAAVLGLAYLAYDVAVTNGADLPGGDARALAAALYAGAVIVVGTIVTYLIVPQPTGAGGRPRRSIWSAALGFFAAIPIAYIGLIVTSQILKPLLIG